MAKQLTFNKQERLKSHKLIEHLFTKGKSYTVFPIKAIYQFTGLNAGVNLQAGVAVSKKNFKKAVDRNRIKRLLREAYRLQKNELQNQLESKNKQLAIFFIYTGKELPLLTDIIEKLKAVLLYLNDVLKEEEK
ncbi:MAG TPA: ribonuclease P protein component [Segetibacter sp.]